MCELPIHSGSEDSSQGTQQDSQALSTRDNLGETWDKANVVTAQLAVRYPHLFHRYAALRYAIPAALLAFLLYVLAQLLGILAAFGDGGVLF